MLSILYLPLNSGLFRQGGPLEQPLYFGHKSKKFPAKSLKYSNLSENKTGKQVKVNIYQNGNHALVILHQLQRWHNKIYQNRPEVHINGNYNGY